MCRPDSARSSRRMTMPQAWCSAMVDGWVRRRCSVSLVHVGPFYPGPHASEAKLILFLGGPPQLWFPFSFGPPWMVMFCPAAGLCDPAPLHPTRPRARAPPSAALHPTQPAGASTAAREDRASDSADRGLDPTTKPQFPASPPPHRPWMCVVVFVGTNGQTYFITASLVTSIQNFPKSRGPTVGILKGFMGLTSAILTQVYAVIHTPDHATLIFLIAVGPSLVAIGLMFVIRPVGGHRQVRPSDKNSFMFIYTVCLLLASYLVGIMLVQDFLEPSYDVVVFLTVILFVLIISPIAIPLILSLMSEKVEHPMEEALLSEPLAGEASTSQEKEDQPEVFLSEVEEEKPKDTDSLPPSERRKRIAELQAKLVEAAARGGVRIKRRPHRGDNFTLMQAFVKADFWLIWLSLLLGSGSGLTVIDNLGQMSQASGFKNAHIFVSLMSIWNFLGRVGGGYFSETIVRERTYPRHIALTFAQIMMAAGHFLFAMAWPGTMYIASLLVGLGYGAHWAIVPAAVSELFGVKHFGAMYNFLILANPTGSLIFSGLIVSNLYEYEAEKQGQQHQISALMSPRSLHNMSFLADGPLKCEGPACFFVSSLILSVFCVIGAGLSLLVVHRTKRVYARLYSSVRT